MNELNNCVQTTCDGNMARKLRGCKRVVIVVQRLLAGNLQPDFQIAVTHSILKLKSFLNTTTQNDLKWRKTCTGLKFDLEHFNGPQTKFIVDSL